jgi:hypothetical protein
MCRSRRAATGRKAGQAFTNSPSRVFDAQQQAEFPSADDADLTHPRP